MAFSSGLASFESGLCNEQRPCVLSHVFSAQTDTFRGTRKGKALCMKTNMKGETPLHVAAIHGDMDHVVNLIEVLSHPVNVVDGAGWFPLHEAAFHDLIELAFYLLDRGARLDDPGCPLDASTSLFEAVHNGSLTTALMLVRRRANLWPRSRVLHWMC
ncbi:hypothetical protein P879_02968 [Paragonimus westermani]|uniref:Uncharacterized protein n=1 Tax=Paragonimus westermani TaxID=34504 RepID=A0A8T0DE54_9TREM|nr:hypothetical protein P879_02968 [Paragonimus westermani]